MVKISSAIIFGLILAGLVTLILVPILYSRALRRREKSLRLRGYVMRDQQLRQALLEEQKKKAAGSDPPNPSEIE
jgi:multidrug efflux pump subunit AcrB